MLKRTCPRCLGTGQIPDRLEIGQTMQKRRMAAKKTLREVAAELGKSVSYISDLEHGRKHWRGPLKLAYLDALGGLDEHSG